MYKSVAHSNVYRIFHSLYRVRKRAAEGGIGEAYLHKTVCAVIIDSLLPYTVIGALMLLVPSKQYLCVFFACRLYLKCLRLEKITYPIRVCLKVEARKIFFKFLCRFKVIGKCGILLLFNSL